jgi:DnaJ-class molecular chaperone
MAQNYYELLGISAKAGADEIKSAYRKLARQYHPDVTGGDKESENKFKAITEAYETLSDETKRKRYDILRGIYEYNSDKATASKAEKAYKDAAEQEKQQKQEKQPFSNVFNDILEGFKPQPKAKIEPPKNGEDIITEVTITVAEALHGCSKTVNILTTETCPSCRGRKFANDAQCSVCFGKGMVSAHKKITVKIPAKVKYNSKIRIPNEGNPGLNGGKNGDLYLNVIVENNSNFQYDDINILCTIPITPPEAVLGTTINIPAADGLVSMKIMPNSNSGQKYRLAGQGLKKNGKTGDMIVTVSIEIPKTLSDKEIELYKQLQDIALQKVT